jgi:hypothetical protein
MKHYVILFFLFVLIFPNIAQSQTTLENYQQCFQSLKGMLEGKEKISFKKAVYQVENTYLDNQLDFENFNATIQLMASVCKRYKEVNPLQDYTAIDKEKINMMGAIFQLMKDTIHIDLDGQLFHHLPYQYDFQDVFGDEVWSNIFVIKLLSSQTGNCHSLPYLYKILAEELGYGAEAHLAIAPNHVYIKIKSEKLGWYNTELTSGYFPIDGWLMASGYIHTDAIRNKLYMEALSEKESIALCLLDLAEGYTRKEQNPDRAFILTCCETVLKYYPTSVQAMLLKAETLKAQFESMSDADKFLSQEGKVATGQEKQSIENKSMTEKAQKRYEEMEKLYFHIYKLGYRTMPKEMYLDWLVSLKIEAQKYNNPLMKVKKK